MKTMKKFFASLLVICMTLTLPNMMSFAADEITLDTEITTDTSAVSGEYQYTVAEDGVYKVELLSVEGTEETNRVTYVEGDVYAFVDSPIEVVAYKDDVLNFVCEAYTYNWDTSEKVAGTGVFVWKVTYAGPVPGTSTNPEVLEYLDSYGVSGEAKVIPGETGYYYSFTATEEGHVAFYFNEGYSSADEATLVPDFILTNKTTSTTVKYSTSTDTVDISMRNMTQTYKAAKLAVEPGDEVIIEVLSNATTLDEAVVGWNAVFVYPEGTEANPIAVKDGYDTENTFKTTVPAGTTYYYNVSTNYEGYEVTITGNGNYSVMNAIFMTELGTVDENGKLVANLASAYGSILLSITNAGTEDIELTWSLLAPEGSQGNPVEIEMEEGKTSAEVTYQFEYVENPIYGVVQYFYKWVATEDGYIRVTISADDGSTRPTYNVRSDELGSYVDVTVEGEVWYYYAYNTAEDGDVLYDFSKVTEEGDVVVNGGLIEVKAGDVVVIELQALDVESNMWVDSAITAEVEYVTPDAGSVENAIGAIENTEEGDEAAVEIVLKDAEGNATMVIPADVLAALKDKNISAVITNDFYSWVINGKDIETPEALDLTINFDTTNIPEALVNKALGDAEGGQFSLADNADFGLIAALVFSIADEYEGEDYSLFYYNADGNLECVGNDVVEDGLLAFAFEHASDYLLMQGDVEVGTIIEPDVENPPAENPPADDTVIEEKGDMTNMMVYVIVLMGAALVVAGFVAKKRFA